MCVTLYIFLACLQHHWETSALMLIFITCLMSCLACLPQWWGTVTWFSNSSLLCIGGSAALLVIRSFITISILWISDMLFISSVCINDLFICNNSSIVSAAVNSNYAFTACFSACNCACMFTLTTSYLKGSQWIDYLYFCCWWLRLTVPAEWYHIHILNELIICKNESIAEFSDVCMLLCV